MRPWGNSHNCEKILKKCVMGCIFHEPSIFSETYCFRENPDWHCPTWISHKEGSVNLLSEMIKMRLQAFIKHHLLMLIYDKLLLADIGGLLMMGMKYLLAEAGT